MTENRYLLAGTLEKPQGLKGEIRFRPSRGFSLTLAELNSGTACLFIQAGVTYLSYNVLAARFTGKHLIIKLEGINNRNDADKITRKEVFLPQDFGSQSAVPEYFSLSGFIMKENNGVEVGKITDILEFPMQILAQVDFKGKELLVPLNSHTVQKIDEKTGTLFVILPEGIKDI